jgi:hypothetical protein
VTSDNGDHQEAQEGWEEKAAKVLNAVMVMAIGLAIGALGVWVLWQFAAARMTNGFGPNTDWMDLLSAALFIFFSVQIVRYGMGMHRSKRQ